MSDGTLFTKEEFDIVLDTLEERIFPWREYVLQFFLCTTLTLIIGKTYISSTFFFWNEIFLDEDYVTFSCMQLVK